MDLDDCAVTVFLSSMGIDELLLSRAVWPDIGPQIVQERTENGEWRVYGREHAHACDIAVGLSCGFMCIR